MKCLSGVCTVFLLSLGIARSQTIPTNWANRIVSKTKRPLASWVNPHVSAVNVLIIEGKRFEHVRGLKKFYLWVPQANAILFITDEKNYSITYHVFKMETGEDIAIPAKGSAFGRTIGSINPQDKVKRADARTIVLSNLDEGARSTLPSLANLESVESLYYLDLDRRAVAEKTSYYDKAGKLIIER